MKPILKWVGGKTQLMNDLVIRFPTSEINDYHEPFVGGGSVLFTVLSMKRDGKLKINGNVYASDRNEKLINFYKVIQDNPNELFECLNKHVMTYGSITGLDVNRRAQTMEDGMTSKESYYYFARNRFNNHDIDKIERASLFMFLNKTCFRGVYRESKVGFNVPYGHYKRTPGFVTHEEILKTSELIKDVNFTCQDYSLAFQKVSQNDFVYADPPYFPDNKKSFVGYTVDGFTIENHKKLFKTIRDSADAMIMMSNAHVKDVTDAFHDWKIDSVLARRAIHSKDPSSVTNEVIVKNFT